MQTVQYFHLKQAKVVLSSTITYGAPNASERLRRVCTLATHHKGPRPTDSAQYQNPTSTDPKAYLPKHTHVVFSVRVHCERNKRATMALHGQSEEHLSRAGDLLSGRCAVRLCFKASPLGRKTEATSGLAVTSALDPWHLLVPLCHAPWPLFLCASTMYTPQPYRSTRVHILHPLPVTSTLAD